MLRMGMILVLGCVAAAADARATPRLTLGTAPAVAGRADALYTDERIAAWAALFLKKDDAALIAAVEADLRSNSPHPLAPMVWTTTHHTWGRLAEAIEAAPADLREKLGPTPKVFQLHDAKRFGEALALYPVASVKEMRDYTALVFLARCAIAEVQTDAAAAYAIRAIDLAPEQYQPVWAMEDILGEDDETDAKIAAEFAPGSARARTPAGALVSALARDRLWLEDKWVAAPTMIAHLRAWLKDRPDDMIARYALAVQLRAAEERGEPERLFFELAQAYPFGIRGTRATAALLAAGRDEDAAKLILMTSRYADLSSEAAQRALAERLVRGAIEGGLLGKARELLEKALERWPADGALNDLMAGIEVKSKRYDYAAPFARKAMQADPDNPAYSTQLLNCLINANALGEAARLAEAAAQDMAGRGDLTVEWYRVRSQAMVTASNKAMNDGDRATEQRLDRQRLTLMERAARAYPRSTKVLRELADAQMALGKEAEAIDAIRLGIRIQPWSTRSVEWLHGKMKGKDAAAAARMLAELRAAKPYVKSLWTFSARDTADAAATEALWRQAIAANPGRSWAVEQLVEHLLERSRWDDAARTIEALGASPEGTIRPGDRAEAARIAADVSRRRARVEPIKPQELPVLLERLEKYRELNGPRSAYHLTRAHLFESVGDTARAGAELLAASASDPSWERPAKELVERFPDEVGRGAAMAAYLRYVMRDPCDGVRVAAYANYHATWSGSPVEAIRWCNHLKDIGAEQYDRDTEAGAMGRLGDKRRRFEIEYAAGSPFGATWRYVRAYDLARSAAEDAAPVSVRIDPETGVVTIRQEDGPTVRVLYHPLSGEVLWREIGPVRIESTYGPTGDVRRSIAVRGACQFTLSRTSEAVAAKIASIDMTGVGVLRIAYDAQGKETRTAEPAPGSGLDAAAAQKRIETAFFAARDALEGDDNTTVFSLLTPDAEAERLRTAAAAAITRADTDKSIEAARAEFEARLELAACLAERCAADPRHQGDAAEHAAVVFDEARDLKSEEGVRYAVRAILIKHRLLMDNFPDGLPQAQWDNWLIWRNWLTGAVPQWGEKVRELVEAARRFEQQPPILAESAQWLPRSDLVNQGFWRRHPMSTILPRALGDRVTLDAAMMRFNDDVVVGTSAGLAVYRKGFWQWYGFDEKAGRFSAAMDPADVKASSAVLSLAEDQFGVLWVGTANGLLRLGDDYEDAPQRWVTPYDGLPVPRVDKVVAWRNSAVAGTSRGARIFGEGLPPLPGAMTRATVLFAREFDVSHDVLPVDFDKLLKDISVPADRLDWGARVEAEDAATDGRSLAEWARALAPAHFEKQTDDEVNAALLAGYVGKDKQVRIRRTLLVGTSNGLFAMTGRAWVKLVDGPVDDAAWEVAPSRLWVLQDRTLFTKQWNGVGEGSALQKVGGQQEIRSAGRLHGLQIAFFRSPTKERDVGVAVLSDAGTLIYHNGHFESFNLPQGLADRRPIVRRMATLGKTWNLITNEGVYAFEDGRIRRETGKRVRDIMSVPSMRRTVIAWGDSLSYVEHDDAEMTVRPWHKFAASRLAVDARGRLITHDKRRLLALSEGREQPEVIAELSPTVPTDTGDLLVRDPQIAAILVDSSGRIWAACGPSLFCWQEGKALTEYSMFVDAQRFPSQSPYITNIIEIPGAGIFAVASNESPKRYRFQPLDGGLLKLDGDKFVRLGDSLAAVDFFTAATRLDDGTTILGGANGFSMFRAGNHSSFDQLGNTSYRRLRQRPMTMWLGTRGAAIGDVWLFGASGGVAAFRRGQWFFPDRLNWMLPDQHLAAWGARHVHAIATDPAGRIYAGTDRGLVVYNPGGGDATSFLVSNGFEDQAFDIVNQRRQEEMRSLLIGGLAKAEGVDPDVRAAARLRQELDQLERDLDYVVGAGPTRSGAAAEAAEADLPRAAEIRTAIREKQKALLDQIGKLRARFPELMESLKIQPRELALKRERLPENYVLVQYIVSPNEVNILLTSRQLNELVKVKVPQAEINERIARVTEALRRPPDEGQHYKPEFKETLLDLAWLYDQLLRPIEQYLPTDARVLVIPDRSFAAVPMAALIRLREDKDSFDYAAERLYLGTLHTPEQLQAALDRAASKNTGALIVADPDGSLAAARQEAADVRSLLKAERDPLIGERATLDAIEQGIEGAKVCHIATHAVLNGQAPDKSYLVLANGQKLDTAGCMTLPFNGTRLVVLSACQTGVGTVSLEFDTLANAFGAAGVTTTVASLWRVGDEATHLLMSRFYKHLGEGHDATVALALAQREFIAGEKHFKSPRAWAGFAVWGKP